MIFKSHSLLFLHFKPMLNLALCKREIFINLSSSFSVDDSMQSLRIIFGRSYQRQSSCNSVIKAAEQMFSVEAFHKKADFESELAY